MTTGSLAVLLTTSEDETRLVAISQGRSITLGQLRRDVAANAARLRATGCRRGLLIAADTYWAVVGMLGLFKAGAEVVLPQNTTPLALAAIRDHWDLRVGDLPGDDLQLQPGEADGILHALNPENCRLHLFTSGSTGAAKPVTKTLAAMEREAAAIDALLGADVPQKARVLGTVTHQHLFGLSYKLFWPLCSGRVIDGTVNELWESLLSQDLANSVLVTSPAHLTRLVEDMQLVSAPPARVLSAGAALPLCASRIAERLFGKPICEIYGSTETGTIAWRDRGAVDLPWQPLPGVVVVRNADGLITVRSPFLADDAQHLGSDLISPVTDGGFHLLGRADRIAKVDGKRVALADVEAELSQLPTVSAARVLILPGEETILAAVVVPSAAGQTTLDDIGAFRFGRQLRAALEGSQEPAGRPRRWRFVAAMPVNALGKTLEQDLLALFQDETKPTQPDARAVRRHGAEVEIDLFNRPDLQQLDGHFPGMPIIPGVAQIDWAVKLAARHFDLPIEAATDFQVKFHRLTLPGTLVTLKLTQDVARQRLTFVYRQGEQVLTSGTIRMATS